MPRDHGVIGDDRMVANSTIVANVGVDHEHIVIADDRASTFLQATVYRSVFSYDVTIADLQVPDTFASADMLRTSTQNGSLGYLVVFAQSCVSFDHHMACQFAAFSDHGTIFDNAKRSDRTTRSDTGLGVDDCSRMDACHVFPLVIESHAPSSDLPRALSADYKARSPGAANALAQPLFWKLARANVYNIGKWDCTD